MTPTKTITGVFGATALIMGGVDTAVLNEVPIERVEMIGEERVEAKQIGNVVETSLPWKGESGLKVKYDMGEPTLNERFKDKRDREVITEVVDFEDGGFKIDILLDKKPDSNVFCYAIEGYENYDFFYQPALTQQEIEEGNERPENIIGSYAVYHKSLKNNGYKTGKVMHIPRPQVWEVNNKVGTTIWADLSYTDGSLCVTVDEQYLINAKYPVRVDPTFGYTSVGASASNWSSTNINGTLSTLSETGTVSKTSIYIIDSGSDSSRWNTGEEVKGALYSSSGTTGTFTTYETEVRTTGITLDAWNDFVFTTPPTISSGNYYVVQFGSNNNQLAADTGSSGQCQDTSGNSYPTFSATITCTSTFIKSVYATYSVPSASRRIILTQ